MHDAHSRATTASTPHRKLKDSKANRFSPSYGVHKGLIRDPNWPPAEFPVEGNAAMRRARRISCEFMVAVDGQPHTVKGDLSKGGAMFMLPLHSEAKSLVVSFGGASARAELLSTTKKNGQVAHHVRFLDANDGQGVWSALIRS